MADIRIKDLATTASSTAADDFLAVDGTTNGTRKLSAATPSFATSVTVPGVAGPTATDLTLAGGSTGASLVLGQGVNGAATLTAKLNGDINLNSSGSGFVKATSLIASYRDLTDTDQLVGHLAAVGLTNTNKATVIGYNTTSNYGFIYSGIVGSNWSPLSLQPRGGNLLIGTTNDSGGERLVVTRTVAAAALATAPTVRLTNATGEGTFNSLHFAGVLADAYVGFLDSATAATRRVAIGVNSLDTLSVNGNGNVLIGTTTDSGNGKLQLATHTTSAGGIGFGTDTSLYRAAQSVLAIDGLSTGYAKLRFYESSVLKVQLESVGGDFTLATLTAGKSLKFHSGNDTLALTLASNQAATFAGDIVGKKIVLDVLGEQLTMTRTGVGTAVLAVGGSAELYGKAASYAFYNAAGSSAYLTIASSAAATFAGAVAINNTVATAVAVASTHKVTMVIGGVTYYLLASNV